MKAVICAAYGTADDWVVEGRASPSPRAGEVKIALRACGVSYTDVLRIADQYAVFVDGELVVEDGRCLTIDLNKASAALQAAQARSIGRTEQLDWAGRSADEMAPMVFESI